MHIVDHVYNGVESQSVNLKRVPSIRCKSTPGQSVGSAAILDMASKFMYSQSFKCKAGIPFHQKFVLSHL